MRKLIFHETRVQGTWLSGSKSHCSISSREVVLSNDGKKRRTRRRLGAIFKKICKVAFKALIALGALAELASIVLKHLGW